jgi:hypothetical protein
MSNRHGAVAVLLGIVALCVGTVSTMAVATILATAGLSTAAAVAVVDSVLAGSSVAAALAAVFGFGVGGAVIVAIRTAIQRLGRTAAIA